jgi:hypothetical protein
MRFSQRQGITEIKAELEKEELSEELLNTLWTMVLELVIDLRSNDKQYGERHSPKSVYYRELWIHFFKIPIDELPWINGRVDAYNAKAIVRNWFFKAVWYEILDFIEYTSKFNDQFQTACNVYLKREMSAYRFIDGVLCEINSKEEVVEIQDALKNTDPFVPVKTHLKAAIGLMSNRDNPDFRNSIKESISAVESLCKIILKNDKTTLGQALKEIEVKHSIPGSLKSAFSALYGYTSDEGGIRHALLESGVTVELEEARFMLVTCSAFINYLISKL